MAIGKISTDTIYASRAPSAIAELLVYFLIAKAVETWASKQRQLNGPQFVDSAICELSVNGRAWRAATTWYD